MNLKNKLKNIPKIYYLNLDHRIDRREYMETQFDYWGISDFSRISASKYLSTEKESWQHLILDNFIEYQTSIVANSLSHLDILKTWLKTTDEKYLFLMEDDYDLSLIEYWNFDWEYLMNHIPENWDCIQLGFENDDFIPFFLHPTYHSHGFGPCILKRKYVEKLVSLHCLGDKYKLNLYIGDKRYQKMSGTIDHLLIKSGLSYSIPLITNNPHLGSDINPYGEPRLWFEECRDLYYNWWKNEHRYFTLEEFFTYGKKNDGDMIREIKYNKEKKKMSYA